MRENINDLLAFIAVAQEQSFTRAAARLGTSQPALSRTIRDLEARLGLRLLTRTTRSVSPTEAGERLLQKVAPHFDEIETELGALSALRDTPSGTVRINCSEYAAEAIIWPKLAKILPDYPDIKLEIFIEHSFTDIAAERFDAGVRLGESLEKDMIAVRIGPDWRLVAVATPGYFAAHGVPQHPQDLLRHNCICRRQDTSGGLYAWEFEKAGQALNVRVGGQLTFNNSYAMMDAALSGMGIAYVPNSLADDRIASGALQLVLDDWSPFFDGYFLYYPTRRQNLPAFRLIVDALRHRGA